MAEFKHKYPQRGVNVGPETTGENAPLHEQTVNSDGSANVRVTGASVAKATGAGLPAEAVMIAGAEGTNLRAIATDASGRPQMTLRSSNGNEPSIGSSFDGVSTQSAMYTNAYMLGRHGGGWEQLRVANVFKFTTTAALASGSTVTIWTPASGKKFRLMGIIIACNTAHVLFAKDGAGGANALAVRSAGAFTHNLTFGQGRLSSATNNILEILNSSGTAIDLQVTAYGTEE